MNDSRMKFYAVITTALFAGALHGESASAQTPGFTLHTLHSFSGSDGTTPTNAVVRYGNTFYGAVQGGPDGDGVIFSVTPTGDFQIVHSFTGTDDGAAPYGIVLHDGALYGTTKKGGRYGFGTLFKLRVDEADSVGPGTFTTIRSLTPAEAYEVATPSFFVGETMVGYGNLLYGTIFTLTLTGTVDALYNFSPPNAFPNSPVLGIDGNYYGTTEGWLPGGTIWEMTPSGSITILYTFNGTDGENPLSPPTQVPDGTLYGTTALGGSNGGGVVYRYTLGGEYSVLHNFSGGSDGSYPRTQVTLGKNGYLYGTTEGDGAYGCGTVFEITTTGELITIYSFSGQDGCAPYAPMVLTASGNLIGSTSIGGASNLGTVFELVIP